ncbi:MAG: ribonuclease III [Clostridia bacterium]|nr:ribonuclease III [Clostridia bacterium]
MVDDGNGERKVLTTSAPLTKNEARQISPVTLAFLGDAVYSLYVRERLTVENGGRAADLQRVASKVVSAQGQSEFLEKLFPLFTEEEADVFRRGKNAKKATKSKSASNLEYSRSTGFEAVLGYLYLIGEEDRIKELLNASEEKDFESIAAPKPFKPVHH